MNNRTMKKLKSFTGTNGQTYMLLTGKERFDTLKWCTDNFKPGMVIDEDWHPVVIEKLKDMQRIYDHFKNLSESC